MLFIIFSIIISILIALIPTLFIYILIINLKIMNIINTLC